MNAAIPERVRWAVDVLDVRPSDRVLEIGPGPGVAAALIGERLVDGRLVAIDRSEVAVRRALERNRAHVAAGRVEVRLTSLEAFDGSGGPFEKVFAINVNLFWVRDATAELARLRRLLAPGGALYLVYDAPGATKRREIVERVRRALRAADFEGAIEEAPAAVAIIARPRPASPG